jgi:hypothetical protein
MAKEVTNELLDKMAKEATERVLSQHVDVTFWEGLGEPLASRFKTVANDLIKVGIAIGSMLEQELKQTAPEAGAKNKTDSVQDGQK